MSAVTRMRRCISFTYSGGCAAGGERKGELVTSFQKTSVGCQERKRRERRRKGSVTVPTRKTMFKSDAVTHDCCVESMN